MVLHAREHAGAAALERARVDARALQRLPGCLQHEPLLRVGDEGLLGADAEERGVEVARPAQESALADVRRVGALPGGVDDAVDVPAPVVRERADGVGAVGDEPPQVLRCAHTARVAAGHADDREGLVGGGGPAGAAGAPGAGALGVDAVRQEGREGARRGVVEDQRGGQAQAGLGGQGVAQLDRGERVEAEVLERAVGLDGLRVAVAEDGRDLDADGAQQRVGALLRTEGRHPFGEAGPGALGRGLAAHGAPDQGAEDRGEPRALGAQCGQAEADGRDDGAAGAGGRVEQGGALLGGQVGHAAAGHAGAVTGVEAGDHAAVGGCPGAPGQREGGGALGVAVGGEGVQDGVGGGVVALAGRADGAGDGGEEDERLQVRVRGQFVEIEGAFGLGAQHRVEAFGRQRGDHAVVEDAGRVDDGGQRVRGGQGGQDGGQRVAVGDVAGVRGGARAQLREFGDQRVGGAAPAEQGEVTYAVGAHQVAGDDGAEASGGAGQQDRALGVEVRSGGVGSGLGAHQAGGVGAAVAHSDLRFAAGEDGGEQRVGAGARFEVEEHEAVGVLRLRRADQAPHGGAREVGHVLAGDVDSPAGDDDQGARVVVLEGGEHGVGGGAHGVGGGARHALQEAVAGVGRGVVQGQRVPADGEQRVGRVVARGPQVGQRPGGQRGDGGDGRPRRVGQVDGEHVGGHRRQAYAEHGGADGVQGDALEEERQARGVVGGAVAEQGQGVQRGVERGGVQAEAGRVGGGPLGEADLGEQFVAAPPGGVQALEDGAVVEARGGVACVEPARVEVFGVLRRPGGEVGATGGRRRGEQTGGVQGPGLVGGQVLGAGVHVDRAGAGGVGGADGDLDADSVAGGQHQRYFQGEFLDVAAADLVARADGELDHGGAGHHDGPADDVVGEPGVGAGGEAAGEHGAVGVGEDGGGAEQRVVGGVEARGADVAGGGGLLGPEALAAERGGGQVDRAGAGEQRRPVERRARDVQLREGGQEGLGLGALAARGGGEDGVGAVAVDALAGHGGQDGVRADLQEAGDAFGPQGAHAVVEADGVADVPHPVLGGGEVLSGEGAGDVRDDGQGGPVVGQAFGHAPELVEHRLHERRVEGVRDGEAAGLLEVRGERLGLGGVAGDDDGRRAVDGGDADALGEQRHHLVLGGAHGDHRAALGQRLHEPAARGDQRGGVGEVEDAGDVRGGDLADGVPREVVRGQAPGLHQAVEGDLEREQRGLGVLGAGERRRVRAEHGRAQALAEVGADLVEGAGERGELLVQLLSHAGALGALAGEEEGGLALDGAAVDYPGRAVGDLGEASEQRLAVGAEDDGAVLVSGPGGRERVRHVGRVQAGDGVREARGLVAERLFGAARHRPGQQRGRGAGLGGGCGGGAVLGGLLGAVLGRGLFDDGVRVGAAGAEGGHGGAARSARVGPGPVLRQEAYVARGPVDLGGGLVDVQGPRQDAVAQRHDDLDDPGDAGGGLGVPDVGLDRAEPQRGVLGPVLAVGGEQGLRLDGVAEGGAGAVRLDEVDVGRAQPRARQRRADDALLGGAVGRGQAVRRAVLVDGRAADDGEDLVAVAAGVREALQEQHARALAPAGAVGGVGEGLAAPVQGQTALAAERDERAGRRHHGRAAREGERALLGPQRLYGQVDRDQRRGARGVDGDRGPLDAQGVGDAAGDHRGERAGAQRRLGVLVHPGEQVPVVLSVGAREHPDPAAVHRVGGDPGAFQGLPRHFEQQPLLRVHRDRLTRADAEELRLEVARVVQESPALDVRLAGGVRVRVVEPVDVPAAVVGEVTDGVGAVVDEPPELLGGAHPAGEAAAHPDDRDRFPVLGLDLAQPLPGLVQIGGDPLEVGEELFVVRHRVSPLLCERVSCGWAVVSWGPGVTPSRVRCR